MQGRDLHVQVDVVGTFKYRKAGSEATLTCFSQDPCFPFEVVAVRSCNNDNIVNHLHQSAAHTPSGLPASLLRLLFLLPSLPLRMFADDGDRMCAKIER